MNRKDVDRATGLREGVAASLGALGPTLLLIPQTLALAEGSGVPHRPFLIFLLLETTYVLAGCTCLGASARRTGLMIGGASLMILPAVGCLLSAALYGASLRSLVASQSAAGAAAVLGWGCGRAARDACGRAGPATGLALLLATAFGVSVLPVSHLSALLGRWPLAGEVLLGANPFIAVTHGGGYDLIRSRALYDALSLSGYRFHYAGPVLAPMLLTGLGLALGLLRITVHRPPVGRRARRPASREVPA